MNFSNEPDCGERKLFDHILHFKDEIKFYDGEYQSDQGTF